MSKTFRPNNIDEMIDDLFSVEEILTKDDTLFIESNVYKGWFDYESSIVEYYIHPEKCLKTTIGYMLKLGDYQQNCLSNLKFSVKPIQSTKTPLNIPAVFGEDFRPSAVSVLDYPYANIRFVNYLPPLDGGFRTKNGEDVQTLNAYMNIETKEVIRLMDDKSVSLPRFETNVKGLEDIRLFKDCDQLKFTSTSVREYEKDKITIVTGDYNLDGTYTNCKSIDSPTNSTCEKNWLNISGTDEFIYSWNPLQIGKIRNNKFYFNKRYTVPPLFNLFRGSAPAIKYTENTYICLVHMVEYAKIRNYYHCFVELDESYKPINVTLPFVFGSISIEYCLSIRKIDNAIECFPGFMESNPHKVTIPLNALQWINLNGN